MAIYLDEQTRGCIESLVKKRLEAHEKDFVAKRLWSMLETDRARIEDIENCEHEEGLFTGEKNCCKKCGSFFKEGMGETWHAHDITKSISNET